MANSNLKIQIFADVYTVPIKKKEKEKKVQAKQQNAEGIVHCWHNVQIVCPLAVLGL